jgi:hypothetical protein
MKDFLGNKIIVGDSVVFYSLRESSLIKGKITSFVDRNTVFISYKNMYKVQVGFSCQGTSVVKSIKEVGKKAASNL